MPSSSRRLLYRTALARHIAHVVARPQKADDASTTAIKGPRKHSVKTTHRLLIAPGPRKVLLFIYCTKDNYPLRALHVIQCLIIGFTLIYRC